ncbi:MAG: NUDIX hydrolase [Actinomyces sp.]|nr:MAG: NUDIX hydrolase [Actinomyces sp.]
MSGDGFGVVGDEVVHRGRILTLVHRRVHDPEGQVHDRDVVHHPGAVAVVPVVDGEVVLVRQYRAALDADLLEIPAGLRDVAGEDPAVTAHRELAEEVGLATDELEHLVTFHNSPGFSDEQVIVYLATDLRPVPDERHGPEERWMSIERIPVGEAVAMALDGRLSDVKTIVGLLVAARRHGW